MDWTDIAEYESLRAIHATHTVKASHNRLLIQSGPGQTIMLSAKGPYVCFRIVESGVELPLTSVASAVPKGAGQAKVFRKTSPQGLTEKPVAPRKKPADG